MLATAVLRSDKPPFSKTYVGTRIALIFIASLLIALIFLVPISNYRIEQETQATLKAVESSFDQIREELTYLLDVIPGETECSEALADLRKSVFNSDRVKEIGLFDDKGIIYCTSNNGKTSFGLYQTIVNRIDNSPEHLTLSYTETKLSRTRSIALVFATDEGHGLSVLIPPRYVLRDVQEMLGNQYVNIGLRIISRSLTEQPFDRGINYYQARSDRYPLELEVSTTFDFYLHQYVRHIWIAIVLASLVSTLYLFLQQRKQGRNSLANSLRYAIANDDLHLEYQPIMNLKTGELVGCESLLRWDDPVQGIIPPDIFIPLAEKVDLIEDVTKLVMRKVCYFLTENRDLIGRGYVSINISRSVILRTSFMEYVDAMVQSCPPLMDRVVFEITENNDFSPEELKVLKEHLGRMAAHGFRFAVDDFGTGYSGLDFIRQFPFSYVKIDRVFVKSLYDDSTIIPLLESMKTLATQLNMEVIVEGVEEEVQLNILDKLGFVYIQGYYYSRPLREDSFLSYLSENVARPEQTPVTPG